MAKTFVRKHGERRHAIYVAGDICGVYDSAAEAEDVARDAREDFPDVEVEVDWAWWDTRANRWIGEKPGA